MHIETQSRGEAVPVRALLVFALAGVALVGFAIAAGVAAALA